MKKIIVSLGFIIIASSSIFAQENKIEFGIKAGVNYSNSLVGKDIPSVFPIEYNGKIGFTIGGFLSLNLTENLKFKPELLFSLQNTEYDFDIIFFDGGFDPFNPILGTELTYNIDIEEKMILIPLMLDYNFNRNFDIEIGPQFGFVINQNITDNSAEFSFENEDYDKFEIALNIGVGYSFLEKYRVGLRYSYGFIERDNLKSSVYQLSMNYLF